MAIEQLGESLLSDVRKRNEQAAKKARKQEEKNALLGLGVNLLGKIGNQVLSDKMTTFLNNESILTENAQFKAATNVANFWSPRIEAVNKSGKNAVDYYYETMRPVFEEQAKAEIDFGSVGDAGQYNALINSKVRDLAEQEAERHDKATKLIGKLGTEEEFDARVALVAKSARPTNLFDMGYKTIKRTLSGKSQDQLDAEAIDALQNSKAALAAEELLAFQERYKETGSLVQSYDYAKLAAELESKQDKDSLVSTSTRDKVEVRENKVFSYTVETKTNRNTGEVISEKIMDKKDDKGNVTPAITITDQIDPKELEQIDLKSRITQFNFATDAKAALKPEAYTRFVKEVQDSTGVLISNIQTLDEYNKVSKLYTKYINADNLVDPINAAFQQKVFSEWTQNGLGLSMFLQAMSKDPNKKNEYFNQTLNLISTGQDLAESLNTNNPAYIFRNSGN